MKLLSLNLHLLVEETISKNQDTISRFIFDNDIDVIFLQEVAQRINSPIYNGDIKVDNYGKVLMDKLEDLGKSYYFYYEIGNISYNTVDEGVAILSKYPLVRKKSFYVSRETSYDKFWTRRIVKASINYNNQVIDLISVHLGWTHGEEVFEDQIDQLMLEVSNDNLTLIGGDFNVSETSKEYQHTIKQDLTDLYYNGDESYFHDRTHMDYIDVKKIATRIDYIFSNRKLKTISREIVFEEDRVSDHFGVMMEIEVN